MGLVGFAAFFLVLALFVEPLGVLAGFGAATAAAFVINGLSFFVLRWSSSRRRAFRSASADVGITTGA
jgi:hypothetical protein